MKKLAVTVLALLMLLAIPACNKDEGPAPTFGSWNGNVYTNDFMGLSYAADGDIYTEDRLNEIDSLRTSSDVEELTNVLCLINKKTASAEAGGGLISEVNVQFTKTGITVNQILNTIAFNLSNSEYSSEKNGDNFQQTIAGKSYTVAKFDRTNKNTGATSEYYACLYDAGMYVYKLFIEVDGTTATFDSVIARFSAYTAPAAQ